MIELKLIPMNPAHIPPVLAIERTVFTTPWTKEMFRQEVRGVFGSRAVVATVGDEVIGYRIAWFIDQEVHLVNIAVARRRQGEGIGTLLLKQLIEEAVEEGTELITLEVRESNARAQAFYRRFFFRAIGVRTGYYSDNREDALLMVLRLDDIVQRRGVAEGKSHAT